MAPRDSDDLLRNITERKPSPPGRFFFRRLSPPPVRARPYSAAVSRAMCAFHPPVLTLSFGTRSLREAMSIESVTLKNPLTRLRDRRPYYSVTVIVGGRRRSMREAGWMIIRVF